ncbi:MAG TPA: hypothetical protein PLJ34_06415, partial [Hyphomicrobiales bacterium]|nr:hypothetical protein [Hyphomicrobiales bacterium]
SLKHKRTQFQISSATEHPRHKSAGFSIAQLQPKVGRDAFSLPKLQAFVHLRSHDDFFGHTCQIPQLR